MNKLITGLASAALVAAGSLTAATPADAAVTMPTDCYLETYAVRSDTAVVSYKYYNGAPHSSVSTNKLGFVPRSWTHRDFHGGVGPGETLDITVRSLALYSSALRQVNTRVYAKPGDPATVTYSYRTLSTNWSGIRMFAKTVNDPNGVSYLYGLTQYGLNRYTATLGSDGIFRISGGVVVGSSGWWPLKTWAFERTIAWGTGKADVFLATTSTTGELVEYVIPRSAPTQWSRKQLKPSGWGGFTSLNTGRCGGTLNTRRGYLGIQASGYAWTYYDANGEDYSGATLYSCARIATTWTAKPYGLSG